MEERAQCHVPSLSDGEGNGGVEYERSRWIFDSGDGDGISPRVHSSHILHVDVDVDNGGMVIRVQQARQRQVMDQIMGRNWHPIGDLIRLRS